MKDSNPPTEHGSDLLTVSETAERLGLKPSTIRALIRQGRIPFVKEGWHVRIRRSDAEAYNAFWAVQMCFDFATPAPSERKKDAGSS